MEQQKLISLKKYILYLIAHYDNTDNFKYQRLREVINPLKLDREVDVSYILDGIVSYIFKAIMVSYEKKHLNPTDQNILNIIDSEFVIDNAYDYILYLQNAHEELEFEELNIARK